MIVNDEKVALFNALMNILSGGSKETTSIRYSNPLSTVDVHSGSDKNITAQLIIICVRGRAMIGERCSTSTKNGHSKSVNDKLRTYSEEVRPLNSSTSLCHAFFSSHKHALVLSDVAVLGKVSVSFHSPSEMRCAFNNNSESGCR